MMITLRMSEDNARCLPHNTFFYLLTSINLFLLEIKTQWDQIFFLTYQPLNHYKVMFSLNINKSLYSLQNDNLSKGESLGSIQDTEVVV